MVAERFFADTGANRTMHPNPKSAADYYPQTMSISTAAAGSKTLVSEGVGRIELYTANGIAAQIITDHGDQLPSALLAKSYVRPDLNVVDRYHAAWDLHSL